MYHSGGGYNNGRGYAFVGVEDIWETSVLFTKFYCENKTTLKKQSLLKKDFVPMAESLNH